MRRLIAAVGFLLVACSSSSGPAVAGTTASPQGTTSPGPSAITTQSAASPSPAATPSATAGPSPVQAQLGFSCRLPVSETTMLSSGGYSITDGFITFPAATFTADPSGGVVVGQDGSLTT